MSSYFRFQILMFPAHKLYVLRLPGRPGVYQWLPKYIWQLILEGFTFTFFIHLREQQHLHLIK